MREDAEEEEKSKYNDLKMIKHGLGGPRLSKRQQQSILPLVLTQT